MGLFQHQVPSLCQGYLSDVKTYRKHHTQKREITQKLFIHADQSILRYQNQAPQNAEPDRSQYDQL